MDNVGKPDTDGTLDTATVGTATLGTGDTVGTSDTSGTDDIDDTTYSDGSAGSQDIDDTADSQDIDDTADSQDSDGTADSQNIDGTADSQDSDDTTDSLDIGDTADSQDIDDTADSQDIDDTADSLDIGDTADSQDIDDTANSQATENTEDVADGQVSIKVSSFESDEVISECTDLDPGNDDESVFTSLLSILKDKTTAVLETLETDFGLMDTLVQNGIISEEMSTDIRNDQTRRVEKNRRLLTTIRADNLKEFLNSLRSSKSKQSHLASLIENHKGSTEETDFLLEDLDKKTITTNFEMLVEEMASMEMIDALLARDCINQYHYDFITSKSTKQARNREILHIMMGRSKRDFNEFKEILVEQNKHFKPFVDVFSDKVSDFIDGVTTLKVNTKNLQSDQATKINENLAEIVGLNETKNKAFDMTSESENLGEIPVRVINGNVYMLIKMSDQADIDSVIHSEETRIRIKEVIEKLADSSVKVTSLENTEYKESIDVGACSNIVRSKDVLDLTNDQPSNKGKSRLSVTSFLGSFRRKSAKVKRLLSGNSPFEKIPSRAQILGVTVMDQKIFTITDEQSDIKVYDLITLIPVSDIEIPVMTNPPGPIPIAACPHNKILYTRDQQRELIHCVHLIDSTVRSWSVRKNNTIWGLSVTSQHSVLVTAWTRGTSRVYDYTSEGQLIRKIGLDGSIEFPYQTLELSTDRFIVCYGEHYSSKNRLSIFDSQGQYVRSFDAEQGLDPAFLTVDSEGEIIFFTDQCSDGIFMLDFSLKYLGKVKTSEPLEHLSCVHWDGNSNRLFVVEWRQALKCSRILIINPS